jgi:protein-tyrosine phosphatase
LIDLHCHLLPGVDDGPESIADSVAMARVAADDGITTIVATPHRSAWSYSAPPADAARRCDEVREACRQAGCLVEIALGGESYLVPDLADQVQSGLALTINGGRYLLVEWPYTQYPVFADDVLFGLQLRGIVPVIAHAERYNVVRRDVHWLESLVRRGIVIQVTAASLLGEQGPAARKLVETILAENLAHVIATDSHSVQRRAPRLRAAFDRASELVGPERARALVEDVPRLVLENRAVELPAPVTHRPRSFWSFWRSGT